MPLKMPPIKPSKEAKNKEDLIKAEEFGSQNNNIVKNEEELISGEKNSSSFSEEFSPNEAFDSKKEFFRLMAEKIKEEPTNPSVAKSEHGVGDFQDDEKINYIGSSGKVSHYKKMVLRFSFLTLILLLAVAYFSFVKLNVIAYTDREITEDSVNFYAYSNDGQVSLDRSVKASINRIELEASDVFSSTGQRNLGGEIVGKVKIINEYSKNQPLVATTRLLSSDDKIFRIKNTINVPAGGSVEVEIYADEVSEDMAIEPGKFVIPGLWAGLQDKIYAESYEKFELKQEVKKSITQEDVNSAIEKLNQDMINQAEEKTLAINNSSSFNIFSVESGSAKIEISHETGDEVDSFEVSIKNIINVVSLNNEDVIRIIKQKLAILDFDQNLSEVEPDSLSYSLISFNSSKSLAEIKVDFKARTVLGSDDDFINKKHLVNLSDGQIQAYLDNIENLRSYELKFKPSFIKRGPMLVDRITIEYK